MIGNVFSTGASQGIILMDSQMGRAAPWHLADCIRCYGARPSLGVSAILAIAAGVLIILDR
jgi:hypothetical protein